MAAMSFQQFRNLERDHSTVSEEDICKRSCSSSLAVSCRYSSRSQLQDQYRLESKVLGKGATGAVRLAIAKDGSRKAVKSLCKWTRPMEAKREAEICMLLDHPHVVRLERVLETETSIHLVMECLDGGELLSRLRRTTRFSELEAAATIRQILLGVSYLHAKSIAHRDVKLENFMYESEKDSHIKIIDFGFAQFWDDGDAEMSESCGTLYCIAPEVLKKSYTRKADLWSVGVIAYMLLFGRPPFQGNQFEMQLRTRQGLLSFPQGAVGDVSAVGLAFLKALLTANAEQRMSASAALRHAWLQGPFYEPPRLLESLSDWRLQATSLVKIRSCHAALAWTLQPKKCWQDQFVALDLDHSGCLKPWLLRQAILEYVESDNAIDVPEEAIQRLFSGGFFARQSNWEAEEITYSEFITASFLQETTMAEQQRALELVYERFDIRVSGEAFQSLLAEHGAQDVDEDKLSVMSDPTLMELAHEKAPSPIHKLCSRAPATPFGGARTPAPWPASSRTPPDGCRDSDSSKLHGQLQIQELMYKPDDTLMSACEM